MASNSYVNKVVYGNNTIIDISDSTAVASDVLPGKFFYLATGQKVSGSAPIVQGSFTSLSSSGVVTVNVPYSGNGYPVIFIFWAEGGSTYDSTQKRYAIMCGYGLKRIFENPMTYDGTASNDGFSLQCVTKGSSATSYTTGGSASTTIGHQTNPTASASQFVSITANNIFKFFTMGSSYGLYPGKTYHYIIFYSE